MFQNSKSLQFNLSIPVTRIIVPVCCYNNSKTWFGFQKDVIYHLWNRSLRVWDEWNDILMKGISDTVLQSYYLLCRKTAHCQMLSFLLQNFLDNFPSSDVMVFVARTFLLFQMITVYPLLGYLVRVQMMGQIFGSHYPR